MVTWGFGKIPFLETPEDLSQSRYKSVGFSSFRLSDNLFYFVALLAVFLIVLIIMGCIWLFKRYRRMIFKKLRTIYRNTVFSGIIISLILTYLKSFISFALAFQLIDPDFENLEVEEKISVSMTLALGTHLILFPIWSFLLLMCKRKKLTSK